jgi:hypothetical protein
VGGSRERTGRVREWRDKRIFGENASFPRNASLVGASTYHRGQVAVMMRQLDDEPPATDFRVFLVEARS